LIGGFFIIFGINLNYRKSFVSSKINRLILFPYWIIVIISLIYLFIINHFINIFIFYSIPLFLIIFWFFWQSFANSRIISELCDGFELLDNFNYHQAFDYFYEYNLNHNNPVAWSGISWALIGFERYDEAFESSVKAVQMSLSFNQSLQKENINIIRFYTRGAVLFHLKRYETALYYADDILKIDQPTNFIGWNFKGVIYDEMGNHEESMKCYKKALHYNPEYAVKLPNNFNNSQNLINQFNTLIKLYKQL
jgi:tetratricopeptide (TPR) repeat protein